jgi:hypothetical protein
MNTMRGQFLFKLKNDPFEMNTTKATHKQSLILAALIGALAFVTTIAEAGEIGHYSGGFLNIRDYFVPEPGFYGAVYNYFYTTDQLNNRRGNKVNSVTISPGGGPGVTLGVDVNVDMYVLAPALIYVKDIKPLGIRYGALITPTFANASLAAALSTTTGRGGDAESSSFDVGDMLVQPVWLGKTLKHWDFSLAYGFYAPIGKYNTETFTLPGGATVEAESADNIGFGFWTHQIQGAAAWYPWADKRMAIATALTYEIHGEKEDFDLTPGQNLTFNWGISQFLPLRKDQKLLLEVGPAGYDSWQITDDSGSAAANPGVHDEVHAVGGQVSLVYLPWSAALTFHGFHEFAAKDRFQGESFGISFSKKF